MQDSRMAELSNDDWLFDAFRAGEMAFMQCPAGMSNHVNRYGLLTKKTVDGTRHIRYTTNSKSLLEEKKVGRQPEDPIHVSHHPEDIGTSFCGFNHGIDDMTHGIEEHPRAITSTMSLAQLRRMGRVCAFCDILTQGIYSFNWLWQPQLEKLLYCDTVFQTRERLGKAEMMRLLHAVDNGSYYDERFIRREITDSDVGLFIQMDKTLEVNVQKYPCPGMDGKMGGLDTLEFYMQPGGWLPWPVITESPSASENVLSEEGIKKLKSWISHCKDKHSVCSNATLVKGAPTRLLQLIAGRDGVLNVKLIIANHNQRYDYVALSHSWASSKPLKTVLSNYNAFSQGIPWELLSKVYQDTLILTFALGYNYVWIDSLCIIQQDAHDWSVEAGRMGMVYSNASVVFAAQGGELALQKDKPEMLELAASMKDTGDEVAKLPIFVRRKVDHDNFVNSGNDRSTGGWFQRAWCFQERLFAPRILHFGGGLEDITFECNQLLECECGGVKSYQPRPGTSDREISSQWCHLKGESAQQLDQICREYPVQSLQSLDLNLVAVMRDRLLVIYLALCEDFTAKLLTFPDDTLPAMSSLAQRLGPYFGNAYHAGLWEHRLMLTLQWESYDCRNSRRIRQGCPPTYSWASRTGGAIWYFTPTEVIRKLHECILAEVVQISSEPASPDLPYGKIGFSFICLKGNAVICQIPQREADNVGRMLLEFPGGEAYVQIDTQDDIDEIMSPKNPLGLSVLCFELMRNRPGTGTDRRGVAREYVSAVILVPTKEQGCFTRIGFAIVGVKVFDVDARHMEVIIV